MNLFKSPMALIVNGGVCLNSLIWPTSGIRQGCPLSPVLFAMLVSPIIKGVNDASPNVSVLLYADDLLVIIREPPKEAIQVLHRLSSVFAEFEHIVGLSLNRDKCARLLKGDWTEFDKALALATGFPLDVKYKYLFSCWGITPPQEAFAPGIAKPMGRASSMVHWNLDLHSRQKLLELWIVPLLAAPAKVVRPDPVVLASVKSIFHTALKTNSWGLTHQILAHPEEQGGTGLVPPDIFLRWQHGSAFARFVSDPNLFCPLLTVSFKRWAAPLGVVVSKATIPFFQLAKIPLSGVPFLGSSAQSFSKARKGSDFCLPPTPLPQNMPLWHNVLFQTTTNSTYFSPELVRNNVLLLDSIGDREKLIQSLPMVTKSCYRAGFKRLSRPSSNLFRDFHLPSFWLDWGKKGLPNTSPPRCEPPRDKVWRRGLVSLGLQHPLSLKILLGSLCGKSSRWRHALTLG